MKFFLIFICWLSFLFGIGALVTLPLRRKIRPTFNELICKNIFVGYLIVTSLWSVLCTHGKTINVLILLILVLAYFLLRSRADHIATENDSNVNLKSIGYYVSVVVVLFLFSWHSIASPTSPVLFSYSEGDYVLYGKISQFIGISGHENGFNILNSMDSFYNGPEPYHYFDLWGASFVSYLSDSNNYVVLKLIIYPTFYFLCFAGFLCLFNNTALSSVVLSFSLLATGGLYLSLYDGYPFFQNLNNLTNTILTSGINKLSYFYPILIFAYMLVKRNLFPVAVLCLLILCVANVISVPTILPTLFIVLVTCYYTKGADRHEVVRGIMLVTLVAVGFLVFYVAFKRQTSGLAGVEITSPHHLLIDNFHVRDFTTMRNIIVGGIISLLIIYAPFCLIFFKIFKKFRPSVVVRDPIKLFLISSIGISLALWSLLYFETNSFQIFSNITIPVLNVSWSIALIVFLNQCSVSKNRSKFKMYGVVIGVAVLNCFNFFGINQDILKRKYLSHSLSYITAISNLVEPNSLVASLKSADEMRNIFDKYNAVYPLGPYLFLMNKNVNAVNIGDLHTPIDSSSPINIQRSLKAVRDGIFLRYSQRPENTGISEADLMLKFVMQYKINYILMSEHAQIPDVFNKYVDLILTDSVSGERFVSLNLNRLL